MSNRRALFLPAAAVIAAATVMLALPISAHSLDETFSDPFGDAVFIYLDGEPSAPECPGDILSVQVQSDAELIRFIVNRPYEVAAPWSDEVKIWLDVDSFLLFKDEDGSLTETFTWTGASVSGLEVTQDANGTTTTFEIPASYASAITYFYVLSFHQDDEADPDARCGDETASFTVDLSVPPTETPTLEPSSTPTLEPTAEPTTDPTTEPTVEPTTEPTSAPPTSTPEATSTPAATSTVASATQAPAPPSTGSGNLPGAGQGRSASFALAGAILAAGGATLVLASRKRPD